jgi:hypothetical protein
MTCDCAACEQGGGREEASQEDMVAYGGIGSLAQDIAELEILRTETAICRVAARL